MEYPKIHDESASEKHIVASRQLSEHYCMIGDEQQALEVMSSIGSNTR